MQTLPPLEFTLDGPGLSLKQIKAVLRHQEEMRTKREQRRSKDRKQEEAPAAREP